MIAPVVWKALGSPPIYHLERAHVWKLGAPVKKQAVLCGGKNETAHVYRPDGRIYCRYCVLMEGLL